MNWMDWALALTLGPLFLAEIYAIGNKVPGDTISERTRVYFRIKKEKASPIGVFLFLATLGTTTAWYAAHIIGGAGLKI